MLSLRKSASAMNLRKTDRSELNLFPALSFLVVCFIGGYFLWATKDALPSEADNTDFRYAPSRAKELAQELDSIYSCKSGPGMEEFLETWHRKYTSNASAPDNQNDTLRNVYNLFTTLFNPDPTLRPRGFRSDSAYRYVVIQSQLTFCVAEDSMFDYYYESSPPPTFPTDGFYLLRKAGAYYNSSISPMNTRMLSNCFWRKTDTGPTKSGHPQNRAGSGCVSCKTTGTSSTGIGKDGISESPQSDTSS